MTRRQSGRADLALQVVPDEVLRLLGRVQARLRGGTDLPFQGSYTQTKVEEPAYGGHASAMGPPPDVPSARAGLSPVRFEAVPALSEKTYCGGRAKDHLLESGGSGERLTVVVETAPGCDPAVAARVKRELHDRLALNTEIRLCAAGTLERPPGKAVRVVDRRRKM